MILSYITVPTYLFIFAVLLQPSF